MRKLLTTGNPKTDKGAAFGWLTAILHLAPHKTAGVGNVCEYATPGCIAACLNTAGRGGIFRKGETDNVIQRARRERTVAYAEDPKAFVEALAVEIRRHAVRALENGLFPAVRLNGTSDIAWDAYGLMQRFPTVMFYDYTKALHRCLAWSAGRMPANYHLTYSATERDTDNTIREVVRGGVNVAVVFRNVPSEFLGLEVIDGDKHDLRFLDKRGVVVGLKAKGRAKRDKTGFVRHGA